MNITNMTLEADYAVRIVSVMANENRRLDAGALSERTGVTLRFTLKIMRKLVTAGIAKSYKGVSGGYELAKPAGEISLAEVIEAIDGPFQMARCSGPDECSNPSTKEFCRFKNEFDRISKMVQKEMEKIKF
ncbi:MAG TPA: Rrf2 family transcriptional regulator [Oscillospiraceae bacterium]|nr:Rrf2 family transcriptional regulator [Oscillospiraceae bacterium]HPF55036.1 Rrf2 family transcriptional regulator [Clostridiales bacterium]HPK35794.1 Rrf2 family transcriptional regulator [Oscillospiraceae bacterium]HPR75414.1 Rrf2 family transcriptional regulator [Oscillospiraceae bacterium]